MGGGEEGVGRANTRQDDAYTYKKMSDHSVLGFTSFCNEGKKMFYSDLSECKAMCDACANGCVGFVTKTNKKGDFCIFKTGEYTLKSEKGNDYYQKGLITSSKNSNQKRRKEIRRSKYP